MVVVVVAEEERWRVRKSTVGEFWRVMSLKRDIRV